MTDYKALRAICRNDLSKQAFAELEVALTDAARYRWLRDNCESQFRPVARVPSQREETDYEIEWMGKMASEYMDKFIDEAMLRSTAGKNADG